MDGLGMSAEEMERSLHLTRPSMPEREQAMLGWNEDELSLADAYLDQADEAFERWTAYWPNDGPPVPILYLYRHGIELALKAVIRRAAANLEQLGHNLEQLSLHKLDKDLRTHNIKKLAGFLDAAIAHISGFPETGIDAVSRDILDWLDTEDETGETFRYSTVGHGGNARSARPEHRIINFYEWADALHVLGHRLASGYAEVIAAGAESYADMASDCDYY